MTKILIDLATVQQALVTLENVNPSLVCEMAHHPKKDQHGIGQKCPLEIRHLETIAAIKEVLAQPPLPEQEPPQYSLKAHWTDDKRIGVVACVTRPDGGVHLIQTIIDPPLPVQEQKPVGQLQECVYGRGQVLWFNKPADKAMLYTTPPLPEQRKPLTDDVLVPLEILEAAASSLDSFCGNLGWGDADLQNMDNLFSVIEQHKAAHGIKEKT